MTKNIQYHLFCQILMELKFFDRFSKNPQIYNVLKICPVGAELFLADEQTDMTQISYFAILRKALKNVIELPVFCAHWHSKYN